MRRTFLLFLACAASACGPHEILIDGGPRPDGSAPMGRIELESEASLALVFGEVSEIEVRYTEDGVPVRGAAIRFALEGRAHDSSVSELVLTTDDEGRARTSVIAASTAAVFRVRVAADRAASVYVDVSVGNMGFGSLRVGAVYEGGHEGATSREIQIYSQMSCADERPSSPDRTLVLNEPTATEVRFPVLPAGILYAVVGRAVGPSGATLASACVDGVVIVRDEETRVDLDFADEPLLPGGRYALEVRLDADISAGAAIDLALVAAAAHVTSAGGASGLYLDALESELDARGELSASALLAAERLSGAPDAALASRLDDAGVDLGVSLLALGVTLGERLRVVGIAGRLVLSVEDGALGGSWDGLGVELGAAGDPDSPPLPLPEGSLAIAADLALGWRSDADAIGLEALEIALPLGSLATVMIESTAATAGHASTGLLLARDAGCDALAAFVADTTALVEVCDDACAQAACVRALDGVMAAAIEGLESADAARDAITLSGELALIDDDADTVVDRLTALELEGAWAGPLGEGDAVRASLTAARTTE